MCGWGIGQAASLYSIYVVQKISRSNVLVEIY